MSTHYQLILNVRLKKDAPFEVIDFLENGHLYENHFDFRYFHPSEAYEDKNILLFKSQYQHTKNGVDEYRYELFTRILVKDDEVQSLFSFAAYLAQYAENQDFVGTIKNLDNKNKQPDLIYFEKGKVKIITDLNKEENNIFSFEDFK